MNILITILDGTGEMTFEGKDLVEPPPVGERIVLYTKVGEKRGFVKALECLPGGGIHATFQMDGYVGPVTKEEIYINVWDDSPPHAPIYIESCPEGLDEEEVLFSLMKILADAGYKVDGTKVKHPTLEKYDNDDIAHEKFLSGVVETLKKGSYNDHPLVVYSES